MRIFVAAVLLLVSVAVWAACRTESVTVDGKTVICVTCCDRLGNCNTTCY